MLWPPRQDGVLCVHLAALSARSCVFVAEASPCLEACSVCLMVCSLEMLSRFQVPLCTPFVCAKQCCLPSFSPLSAVLEQFAQ